MKLKNNPLINLFTEHNIIKETDLELFFEGTRDIKEINVLIDKNSDMFKSFEGKTKKDYYDYIDYKGIQVVRRDNCPFVKEKSIEIFKLVAIAAAASAFAT